MASKLDTQNDLLARLLAKMEESQRNEPEQWTGKDSDNASVAEVEAYDGIKDVLNEFHADRMGLLDRVEEMSQSQSDEINRLTESLGVFSEMKFEMSSVQNNVNDRFSEALASFSKNNPSELSVLENEDVIEESNEPSPLEKAFAEMMAEFQKPVSQSTVVVQPANETRDVGLSHEIQDMVQPIEPATVVQQEVTSDIPYVKGIEERVKETVEIPEPEPKLGGRPALDGDYFGESLEQAFNKFNRIEDDAVSNEISNNTEELKSIKGVLETISANTAIIAEPIITNKYNDDAIKQVEEPKENLKLGGLGGIQENLEEVTEKPKKKEKEKSWLDKLDDVIDKYALPVLGGITAVASLGKHVTQPIEFEEIEQEDLSSILRYDEDEQKAWEEKENDMAMDAAISRSDMISDTLSDMGNAIKDSAKTAFLSLAPGGGLLNAAKNFFFKPEKNENKEQEDYLGELKDDPFFNKKEISVNAESGVSVPAQSVATPITGEIIEREPVRATPAQDPSLISQQMITEQKNSSNRIVEQLELMSRNMSRPATHSGGIYTMIGD